MITFAKRNTKELLRDPLSLIFNIGLPLFLLVFMSFLYHKLGMDNDAFRISSFAPSTIIFSYSFNTLFIGNLISRDRESSFLMRLLSSPLKSISYVMGYVIPLSLISLIQSILLYITAICLGLPFSIHIIWSILILIPLAFLFTGIGILFGSIFSDKQVGGISSIVIQVVAFTSGMWFPISAIGGTYEFICTLLPFYHMVEITKNTMLGTGSDLVVHLLWVFGYTILIYALALIKFKSNMIK